MRIIRMILLPVLFFSVFVSVRAQTPKPVYDGRKDRPAAKIAPADEKLLQTTALPKARIFWKNAENCEEDFSVTDAARGSFTSPGSDQNAFLYNFCETGHNFSNTGIVIVENERIVAHYVYEGGGELSVSTVPDVDGDGLNELLIGAGGTNQGVTWGTITIVELSPKGVKTFGNTQTYEDNCGADEKGCSAVAYQISATTGARPVFYHQKYTQKGKIWRSAGKQTVLKMDADQIKYNKLK